MTNQGLKQPMRITPGGPHIIGRLATKIDCRGNLRVIWRGMPHVVWADLRGQERRRARKRKIVVRPKLHNEMRSPYRRTSTPDAYLHNSAR